MKKLFNYSDTHFKMIEELKKRTGISNANTLLQNALVAYHKSYFPAYAQGNVGIIDPDETKEERAIRRAEEKRITKEAEENEKLKPKIDMCHNLLGGEVETNEKGFKFCRFTMYSTLGDDQSQMLPLAQVAPIIAETSLFMPDKETVLKKRPDVKKLFLKLEKKNEK